MVKVHRFPLCVQEQSTATPGVSELPFSPFQGKDPDVTWKSELSAIRKRACRNDADGATALSSISHKNTISFQRRRSKTEFWKNEFPVSPDSRASSMGALSILVLIKNTSESVSGEIATTVPIARVS
jgi:hypothetical protein